MIEIRPTTENEVDELLEIQRQAFLPIYEEYHDEGNPCLRGREDITCRLESPNFLYFTILCDGKTVGGLMYKIKGKTPFVEKLGRGEYYLSRVYVLPQNQSKGIATQAILLSEKYLKKPKKLYVDFPEKLQKNRRCYEKAGYCDTGKRLETEPEMVLAAFEKTIKHKKFGLL